MPTRNDDLWRNFDSTFEIKPADDDSSKTTPSDRFRPTSADNRQILLVLFVVDASGSMSGRRIAMVNNAIENILSELRRRDDFNAIFKVDILKFCEDAAWVTPQPIPVKDFMFSRLNTQLQFTSYAPAFDALDEKLSRKAFMNYNLGDYFAPLILFISDGEPTDPDVYPKALERLRQNPCFKKAVKYAVAVGEECKYSDTIRVLSDFSGDERHVRHADEGEALCSLLEFITLRASEIQTSMTSDTSEGRKSPNWAEVFDDKDKSLFDSMFRM